MNVCGLNVSTVHQLQQVADALKNTEQKDDDLHILNPNKRKI